MSAKIIPAIAAAILLGTTAFAIAQTSHGSHRFAQRTYDQVPYRPGPGLYNYAPGPDLGSAAARARAAASCAFGPEYNDTHYDVWIGGDGC